ncbi:MAG: HEPN domain-containing protein [Planctomycetaceae bacterium]|nr:MAG: HEPN domain-containing protein [Planctomycetaceae bacterium]
MVLKMADWNTMASNSYKAANLLMQEQCDRSCISRAYYAAYSRATKALAMSGGATFSAGREGPTHSGLPGMVETHLASLGEHRWRVSDYLRTLYMLRLIADYRPSDEIENTDARKALELMGLVFVLTKGAIA